MIYDPLFMNKSKKTAGFVLIFSLLVSSVILTAGLAVSRIIVRQILLASIQRDSQYAFFAADSGIECGRYWLGRVVAPVGSRTCNAQQLKDGSTALSDANVLNNGVQSFWFNVGESVSSAYPSCVKVTINNNFSPKKKIIADGYNAPCENGQPTGGRIVQRTLVYEFQ